MATNAPGCLPFPVKHKNVQRRIDSLSNRKVHSIIILSVICPANFMTDLEFFVFALDATMPANNFCARS